MAHPFLEAARIAYSWGRYTYTHNLSYIAQHCLKLLVTTCHVAHMTSELHNQLNGQSPSEADRSLASQGLRILWDQEVHRCVHNRPPPIRISEPDQTRPHPTSSRYSLILSSHLRIGLPSGLFPSDLLTKPWLHLSSLPYALHAPPISFFLICSPK
jgi:hypothetical protein